MTSTSLIFSVKKTFFFRRHHGNKVKASSSSFSVAFLALLAMSLSWHLQALNSREQTSKTSRPQHRQEHKTLNLITRVTEVPWVSVGSIDIKYMKIQDNVYHCLWLNKLKGRATHKLSCPVTEPRPRKPPESWQRNGKAHLQFDFYSWLHMCVHLLCTALK